MITVREAVPRDAAAIRRVIEATYGDDYTDPAFYDEAALERLIAAEDALTLVAEEGGAVLGTASVLLESGAYSDLVGEFGRLAVEPRAWGRGVGALLLHERLERVGERLHVGFMEARVTHPFSVNNALAHGFAPLGFMAMKLSFGERREHTSLLVRYFGDALGLRRNHPRIVPEVYAAAACCLELAEIGCDAVVDESAAAYPHGGEFTVQELTDSSYSSLLRIERGRVRRREVFGPMRLHYGFFRLRARHSRYLIARRRGAIAGAVGFTWDAQERNLRIFELICHDEAAIRVLLGDLERRAREELAAVSIEIDVSAHAPRMQRTLVELGYLAAGYLPAFVFHRVERLDVVKMQRLLVPLERGEPALPSPAERIAELVLDGFAEQEAARRIGKALTAAGLFSGLSSEQARRLAGLCRAVSYDAGERIFASGDECRETVLVLDGAVEVEMGTPGAAVGTVTAGECLGEIALLTGTPHSATATATRSVEAAVLPRGELDALVRRRPDIGVVLYRNLARGLGEKLRRTDLGQLVAP